VETGEGSAMWDGETRFWQRFLPHQYKFPADFAPGAEAYHRTLFELIERVSGLAHPAAEFRLTPSPMFTLEQMGSSPVSLALLGLLIRAAGARRVLEIGTFIGVSAMVFARAVPAGGRVVTVEKFDQFAAIARRNFVDNGLAGKIVLLEGDALAEIEAVAAEGPYDFIFLDGNKERYLALFHALAPLLARRGLFVVDDCFFGGDALRPDPQTGKGRGVRELLDHIAGRTDFHRLLLPLGNGILLLTPATPA
jgi:predicted O-methyltransferase YrrM